MEQQNDMEQQNENPILWEPSGPGLFILALGGAVVVAILSAIGLIQKWGMGFLALVLLTLASLVVAVISWYDVKRRILLYSDRIVSEHGWPFPTRVFYFSDITEVDIVEVESHSGGRSGGVGIHESFRVYFSADRSKFEELHTDHPHGLRRVLRDLLERYRTTHNPPPGGPATGN